MYADQILVCRDCKNQFTFTAGEQRFFAECGYGQPTRCKSCREARKEDKARLRKLREDLKNEIDWLSCWKPRSEQAQSISYNIRVIKEEIWELKNRLRE